jgi:hypothetical protein
MLGIQFAAPQVSYDTTTDVSENKLVKTERKKEKMDRSIEVNKK